MSLSRLVQRLLLMDMLLLCTQVLAIDLDKQQFTITLKQSVCASPVEDASYLTSFYEEEKVLYGHALAKVRCRYTSHMDLVFLLYLVVL